MPPPPPATPTPAAQPPSINAHYSGLYQTLKEKELLVPGAWDRTDRADEFYPSASNYAEFSAEDRIPFDPNQVALEVHGYHLPSIYVGKTISNRLHNWVSNPALRPRLLMAAHHIKDKGVISDLSRHHAITRSLSVIRRHIALETQKMNSMQVYLEDCDYRLLASAAEEQLLPWMDPRPAPSPPPRRTMEAMRRHHPRRTPTPDGQWSRVIESGWDSDPFLTEDLGARST